MTRQQGDNTMKTHNNTAYGGPRKTVEALKVLVVDDDPFQLEFIAEVLRGLGVLDITLAASSEQALQAQNRYRDGTPFDLLLCDLHMPGMDGFQLMEAIASAGYKGALIIVSGQGLTRRAASTPSTRPAAKANDSAETICSSGASRRSRMTSSTGLA